MPTLHRKLKNPRLAAAWFLLICGPVCLSAAPEAKNDPSPYAVESILQRSIHLPVSPVRYMAACQDADGYLWVGNDRELLQSDGQSVMKKFPLPQTPKELFTAEDGTVWVWLQSASLMSLRPGALELQPISGPHEKSSQKVGLEVVRTPRGPILLDSVKAQWWSIASGAREWSKVLLLEGAGQILQVIPADEGGFFISCENAVCWQPGALSGPAPPKLLLRPDKKLSKRDRICAAHQGGGLWLSHGSKLTHLDAQGRMVNAIKLKQLAESPCNFLTSAAGSRLWAIVGRQILCLHEGSEGISLTRMDEPPLALDAEAAWADVSGRLWLACGSRGLLRYESFPLSSIESVLPPDLRSPIVEMVASPSQTGPPAIWVRDRVGHVAVFQENGLFSAHLRTSVPLKSVLSICADGVGGLWALDDRGRTAQINGERVIPKGRLDAWTGEDTWAAPRLLTDTRGTPWVWMEGEIPRFLRPDETAWLTIPELASVQQLMPAPGGRLLATTAQGALTITDSQHKPEKMDIPAGIRGETVCAFLLNPAGQEVLISRESGLAVRTQGDAWRVFPFPTTLPSRARHITHAAIFQHEADSIWMTAPSSILRYNLKLGSWQFADVSMIAPKATSRLAQRSLPARPLIYHQGLCWAVSEQVHFVFHPKHIWQPMPRHAQARWQYLYLGKHGTAQLNPKADGPAPVLLPADDWLSPVFHFSMPDYDEAGDRSLRMELDGPLRTTQDLAWQARSWSPGVLPPGEYSLKLVKTSGQDRIQSEPANSTVLLSLRFSRPLPWLRRGWVQATLLMLVGVIAWGWMRLRMERLRQRETLLAQERDRIARDLHDSVGQGMAAASLHLAAASTRLQDDPAAQQTLIKAREQLQAMRQSLKECVFELRQPCLDGGWFVRELERLATDLCKPAGIHLRTLIDSPPPDLPPDVWQHLLRITQEAVVNAVHHASPQEIHVRLQREGSAGLTLQIEDDGKGCKPQEASQSSPLGTGSGLRNIASRAAALHGTLNIRSANPSCTLVEVSIPFHKRP